MHDRENLICALARGGIWLILVAATAAMVVDAVGLSWPVLMLAAFVILAVALATGALEAIEPR